MCNYVYFPKNVKYYFHKGLMPGFYFWITSELIMKFTEFFAQFIAEKCGNKKLRKIKKAKKVGKVLQA